MCSLRYFETVSIRKTDEQNILLELRRYNRFPKKTEEMVTDVLMLQCEWVAYKKCEELLVISGGYSLLTTGKTFKGLDKYRLTVKLEPYYVTINGVKRMCEHVISKEKL